MEEAESWRVDVLPDRRGSSSKPRLLQLLTNKHKVGFL